MLIRPALRTDLNVILELLQDAGIGITSLPFDKEEMERRLLESENAFTHSAEKDAEQHYLFALEHEGKVIGISGIVSRIGIDRPFFAYHLRKEKNQVEALHFIEARTKPTELGSLLLSKKWRGKKMGRLLSFSRFLFVASFRQRFSNLIVAEMRGINNEYGASPFWEAVGRHFFHIPYGQAEQLRASQPEKVSELFPIHPIYPILLPKAAQECIGEIHPLTVPAFKLLRKQGFKKSEYFDIFDAGPHIFAETDGIAVVKNSREVIVRETREKVLSGKEMLISNGKLAFKATVADAIIEGNEIIVSNATARLLELVPGDRIRIEG